MKKVVVGLSGGVDSSVAAAILHNQGYDVIGLTLWLMKGKGQCCSEGMIDAADICEQLSIPHEIVDIRDVFQTEIVDFLVTGYSVGITPLPCSQCNKTVKFGPMVQYAREKLECDRIATGHYAQIRYNDATNRYQLLRAVDRNKDPGDIVDETGKILGQHDGVHHYTIGQRKGLGIAAAEPLYVIELDAVNNKVVVGDRTKGTQSECTVNRVNWVSIAEPATPIRAEVQIRYRSQPVPVTVIPLADYRVRLVFDEPQFSITPGQAAVWYDGDQVLGGGIIEQFS